MLVVNSLYEMKRWHMEQEQHKRAILCIPLESVGKARLPGYNHNTKKLSDQDFRTFYISTYKNPLNMKFIDTLNFYNYIKMYIQNILTLLEVVLE